MILLTLLFLLIIVILCGAIVSVSQQQEKVSQENAQIQEELKRSNALLQRLQKWQKYANAEAELQKLTQKSKQIYANTIAKGNQEAQNIIEKSRKEAQSMAAHATSLVSEAEIQRKNIIEDAQSQAAKIAQEADDLLEYAKTVFSDAESRRDQALLDLSSHKAAILALRRQIEGYGNQYLIPSDNLIDWLANEYRHTEPGIAMKEIRSKIKKAIALNNASDCDYAENYRKEVAKRFVTDAFWGKVESVMAKTKKDNFGKLQQELRDAYNIVNSNGQAFRNARILPAFLEDCLLQIKLLSAVHQVKEQEKEEQRAIKEKMREEEKARREIEKNLKEAAKKEADLQKAIEREQIIIQQAQEEMRKRMEAANDEKRAELQSEFETQQAKYQLELKELNQKLAEAEAKNQRALSMAQQTRAGNMYIISNVGSFGEDVFKIGMTRRLEPLDRVKELGDASVPFSFDVHAMIYSDDAPALETALHKKFALNQVNKINHRKEFFRVSIGELRQELESLGIEVSWTMLAEAREYHETLAIEKTFENDPDAKTAWLNRQFVLDLTDLHSSVIDDSDENEEDF
ncbi:MAG: DUF4041 domain-containing protein [Planctomycetia bacterium]|nr:DUF4041 domain-containing protein [Planctomycetia bacterium]